MKFATKLTAVGLLAAGLASQAHAFAVYGLSQVQGPSLVTFDSASPGAVLGNVAITGVAGTLLSIDVRPLTGQLFGLSSASQLYTINTSTGAASFVANLSTPLVGTTASIDFNPTNDRIRIVTNTGQNLAVVPTTGAVTVNTSLAFAGGDVNAGDVPNVSGVAYTNSSLGALAGSTTLFDFELGNNVLTTQDPPATGVLKTQAPLGATGLTGFDIFAFGNQGFGSTFTNFYSIGLSPGLTDAASLIGAFAPNLRITDIAVSQVPEPATGALVGIGLLGGTLLARRKTAAG